MASNNEFQLVGNQGRRQGFTNLLSKENRLWWRTSRWWMQTLIWLAIGNGILFMVIGVAPRMENPPGQSLECAICPGVRSVWSVSAVAGYPWA